MFPKKIHDHPTSSWILSRKNKKSSTIPNLSMPIIYLQDGAPPVISWFISPMKTIVICVP